jgi:hypothetical protein
MYDLFGTRKTLSMKYGNALSQHSLTEASNGCRALNMSLIAFQSISSMQDYLPFLQSSDAKLSPYFTHIKETPFYFRRVSLANELLDLGQQQQQQQWWSVMWSRADVRLVLDGQYCRRDHHY